MTALAQARDEQARLGENQCGHWCEKFYGLENFYARVRGKDETRWDEK